ncbi:hypothetical protein OROHE_019334 [Orobanche hederae]
MWKHMLRSCRKLIGARYYKDDSARDTLGHGTHTALTAAGNHVKGASFYGIAKGTARGGVPSARIAAYKACNEDGCQIADLLAAFDDAIADGVDIISISIGNDYPLELDDDAGIALGSLHAFQKGILVVQSSGNTGEKNSVLSVMPWIFTVAASSTDRGIVTKIALGDGREFTVRPTGLTVTRLILQLLVFLQGKAVSSFALAGRTNVPVVYGKNVTRIRDEYAAWRCDPGCLEPGLVKEKIVICNDYYGVPRAFGAGANGAVATLHSFPKDLAFPVDFSQVVPLAASRLDEQNFHNVRSYLESTKSSTLDILKSESVRNVDAPKVAGFSSRGPNTILPDILKPDVTAPGMEILAAFSPLASPSEHPSDKRSVKYSVISGTSMSCPHVAGAAAYVKSFHPNWSPSALKSSLMTTAWKMKDSLAEFSYGAGHIDPVRALDPGLVYETFTEDYIKMFCGLGYDSIRLRRIFGRNATCPGRGSRTSPKDLNYPSMTSRIKTTSHGNERVKFSRRFRR